MFVEDNEDLDDSPENEFTDKQCVWLLHAKKNKNILNGALKASFIQALADSDDPEIKEMFIVKAAETLKYDTHSARFLLEQYMGLAEELLDYASGEFDPDHGIHCMVSALRYVDEDCHIFAEISEKIYESYLLHEEHLTGYVRINAAPLVAGYTKDKEERERLIKQWQADFEIELAKDEEDPITNFMLYYLPYEMPSAFYDIVAAALDKKLCQTYRADASDEDHDKIADTLFLIYEASKHFAPQSDYDIKWTGQYLKYTKLFYSAQEYFKRGGFKDFPFEYLLDQPEHHLRMIDHVMLANHHGVNVMPMDMFYKYASDEVKQIIDTNVEIIPKDNEELLKYMSNAVTQLEEVKDEESIITVTLMLDQLLKAHRPDAMLRGECIKSAEMLNDWLEEREEILFMFQEMTTHLFVANWTQDRMARLAAVAENIFDEATDHNGATSCAGLVARSEYSKLFSVQRPYLAN